MYEWIVYVWECEGDGGGGGVAAAAVVTRQPSCLARPKKDIQ